MSYHELFAFLLFCCFESPKPRVFCMGRRSDGYCDLFGPHLSVVTRNISLLHRLGMNHQ